MTEEEKNLSSKLQNLMEKEAGKRKLTLQQIENLIQRHKESIQDVSEYDLTDTQEYYSHWNLISNLGTDYTEREFRKFDIDENNSKLIQFLLYTFTGPMGSQYQYICAGVIITMIPILIIFLFCQKQIYSGMAMGAVKE